MKFFPPKLFNLSAFFDSPENQNSELVAEIIGLCIGCIVSVLVLLNLTVTDKSVEDARLIGIVSKTVLAGYSKQNEILFYIVGIFTFLIVSFSVWFFITRFLFSKGKKSEYCEIDKNMHINKNNIFLDFFCCTFFTIFITFSLVYFYKAPVPFTFLVEEGVHLGPITSLLKNMVLYRDTFYPYGPLMLYPVVALMKIFGTDVVVLRIYTYIISCLALIIYYFIIKNILRYKITSIFIYFIFLTLYFPDFPAPSASPFRVMTGVLAVFLAVKSALGHKHQYAMSFSAGIVAGIALFFSQEVGLAAFISILFIFIIFLFKKYQKYNFINLINFFVGIILISTPIIIYFIEKNSLNYFIYDFISYPKLVMKGHDCLPFPNIVSKISELFLTFPDIEINTLYIFLYDLIFYIPIIFYCGIIFHILIKYFRKKFDHIDAITAGLIIFGFFLFRSALARSDSGRLLFCLPPLLLVCGIYLEKAFLHMRRLVANSSVGFNFSIYISLFLIFITFILPFIYLRVNMFSINTIFTSPLSMVKLKHFAAGYDHEPLGLEKAKNILVHRPLAKEIRNVVYYIKKNTRPFEHIYVFPNEATFYFLTDRTNAARAAMSYQAVTKKMREDEVDRIKSKKIKYIIYVESSFLIDGISENIKVPEIHEYIKNNFILCKKFGNFNILRNKNY